MSGLCCHRFGSCAAVIPFQHLPLNDFVLQGCTFSRAKILSCLAQYGEVARIDDGYVPPGHPWSLIPVVYNGPHYAASTQDVRITRVTMTSAAAASSIIHDRKPLPRGLGRPVPVKMTPLAAHQVILSGGQELVSSQMKELDEVAFDIRSQKVLHVGCFHRCVMLTW